MTKSPRKRTRLTVWQILSTARRDYPRFRKASMRQGAKPAGLVEFFWDQVMMKATLELADRSFARGDHVQPIKSLLVTAIMSSAPGQGLAGDIVDGDFAAETRLVRGGAYQITGRDHAAGKGARS